MTGTVGVEGFPKSVLRRGEVFRPLGSWEQRCRRPLRTCEFSQPWIEPVDVEDGLQKLEHPGILRRVLEQMPQRYRGMSVSEPSNTRRPAPSAGTGFEDSALFCLGWGWGQGRGRPEVVEVSLGCLSPSGRGGQPASERPHARGTSGGTTVGFNL